MNLDMSKLEPLLGTVVNELGAASNAALVILGDKLGLFRTLSEGMMTSAELAKRTGTHERYVREWLSAQAASGFVTYHKDNDAFSMTPEQAAVFADDESPVAMVGGFSLLSAVYHDEPRLAEAFKTGKGLHWSDHCNCMSCGVDRFFRPGYRANLIGDVAAGARRRGRKAATRREGRRRRLRPRLLDAADGRRRSRTRSSSASTMTKARSGTRRPR